MVVVNMNKFIVKPEVTHQGIGGKEFIPEMELDIDDVIFKGTIGGNWACMNFLDRRPDINGPRQHDNYPNETIRIRPRRTEPLARPKLFYGKVGNLGYVVAEDELDKLK